MIIIKVTKKQSFTSSLKNTLLEKPKGGVKLNASPFLGLNCWFVKVYENFSGYQALKG